MHPEELGAMGRVLGDTLAEHADVVPQTHRAIAARVFDALGPPGAPVRVVHDAVSGAVHATVAGLQRAVPYAVGTLLGLLRSEDAPSLASTPGGRTVLGVVNGLRGDRLDEHTTALLVRTSLRSEADEIDREAPGRALPDATGHVVVFVHGLFESDATWFRAVEVDGEARRVSYGTRLRDELGWTPLYARYNSGRRVSDSGAELADLVEAVLDAWPVPVESLALVGYSMGGLVARSACHAAQTRGLRWVDALRHVCCLGTPHLGAPLEKGANVAASLLSIAPESRAFATALNRRSPGIKDLRFGSVVEEDWRGHDPDELLRDRCTQVPFVPTATYSFVGVSVAGSDDGPVARLVGDLLVTYPSASGRGRRRTIGFEVDYGRYVTGLHHFDLRFHPSVYEPLRDWLTPDPDDSAREPTAP